MQGSPKTSRVAQNAVALSILQFVLKFLAAIWTFYLARWLGVQLYGLWANVLALAAIAGVIQGVGILGIIFKDISQDRSKSRSYFGASFLIYGITSLVAFSATLAAGILLNYPSEKMILVLFAGLSLVSIAPALACQSILYGLEDFVFYTKISSTGTLCYMAVGAALVYLGHGVLGVFIALCIGNALQSALLVWRTWEKCGAPVFEGAQPLSFYLVRLGFPLFLSGITSELMIRADRILIERFLGESSVGYYHAAFNLVNMPRDIFFIPILTAASAKLYEAHASNLPAFHTLFERLNVGLAVIALPIAGLFTVFSDRLIYTFYGPNFVQATTILRLLVWILPPLFILQAWQNVFIIQNRTDKIFWTNLAGVGINLAANYFFMSHLHLKGAAIAAVFTQTATLLIVLWILREGELLRGIARIARVAAATAAVTAILLLIRPAGLLSYPATVGLGTLGAALYVGAFILFKVMRKEEELWLFDQIKQFYTRMSGKVFRQA